MHLSVRDKQEAMDYTVYMMVGSYFSRVEMNSISREMKYHLRYQLLGSKEQFKIEEDCERYFQVKVLPDLPKAFLEGKAKASFVQSTDGSSTAVVFENDGWQLWVISLYGGRYKRPILNHWMARRKGESDAGGSN